MYSVQDLLVSHGYKLSRNAAAPHEESHEGRQRARARGRAGQGLLNGCEDGRAAPPQSKAAPGKGHPSDSESSRRLQRVHGEPQSGSASRPSDVGFCNPPVLVWTSQSQPGQQQTYWRRRGQEACGLLEELEGRRMAQAHSLPAHVRESPWEVAGRTENVMKKAVWEEELHAAPWREGSLESWGQPRKLGRHMSDGDGERLFRDLYPFVPGEQVLNPQSKGKSRSLPRVLSPEGLSCTEIPIPLNAGPLLGAHHTPFYPPNCPPHLEPTRHPEKSGSAGAFPRPKFGRPLRPPPYTSYQHPRGTAESSGPPDGQQTDPYSLYRTKSSEPRPELCLSDPALEPPVYVPPPSYRSPPQPIANPYLEEAAPRLVGSARSPQPHSGEKVAAGCPPPASSLAAGHEYGASPRSPRSPRGLPPQPRPTAAATAPDGSVLYIPFDDPRIRHIRLAQRQGFCEEAKPDEKVTRYSPFPVSQPAPGATLLYDALLNPQSMAAPPGQEQGAIFADPTPPWLWDQLLRDGESSHFPEPRDPFGVVRESQRHDPRGGRPSAPEAHGASPAPLDESPCETQTQLRKFETGIPTKKSAKKKTNETIFCLVSIPIKPEPHLPGAETDHKDLKPGAAPKNGLDKSLAQSLALREQSLLSMSATDLELQALTGGMVGRAGLPKQELAQPNMDKQANDLSPLQPGRHGGLKSSGSWPGHQYRDQQTQTTFTEEPKSSAPHPTAKVGGGPNTVLTAKFIDPSALETRVHAALGPGDCKQRPNACHLKGQMSLNLSGNSAFSRTSSTGQAPGPKEGLRQRSVEGLGLQASPKLQGEGLRGPAPGSGHNKEVFGQFLLKPVSRRPWDLISQLESFNKELQEEEGSGHSSSSSSSGDSSSGSSSSEDSDTEWPLEGQIHSTPKNSGLSSKHQEPRVESLPWMLVPETPEFRAGGRTKIESESWSKEQQPARPSDRPPLPRPCSRESQVSALGNLVVEKGKEAETTVNTLASSPGPVKKIPSSTRFSDSKPAPTSVPADLEKPQERQNSPSVVSTQGLSKAVPLGAHSGEQQGPALPLSLASKARGLSAPDLRSIGLAPPQVSSANGLDGSLGAVSATEIPPNESLQERAARILGIEVAVESLLPGARRSAPNQHPDEPSEHARTPVSHPQVTVSSAAPKEEPTVPADAFYGRRKCGWTQSPLFVGERESVRRSPEAAQHPVMDGATPAPAPSVQQPESPNHKDAPSRPPFRSTLHHVVERSPSTGFERKPRGTSKVIESLQEKLASPPRRAAPERLMRMKEVSSVSRMRLLSSLGPDSSEEDSEPGASPSLSLEENGHPAAAREQNTAHDFWCPDSYDPSRVERV